MVFLYLICYIKTERSSLTKKCNSKTPKDSVNVLCYFNLNIQFFAKNKKSHLILVLINFADEKYRKKVFYLHFLGNDFTWGCTSKCRIPQKPHDNIKVIA